MDAQLVETSIKAYLTEIRSRVEQPIQSGIVRPIDSVCLDDDGAHVIVSVLEIGCIEDDVRT